MVDAHPNKNTNHEQQRSPANPYPAADSYKFNTSPGSKAYKPIELH